MNRVGLQTYSVVFRHYEGKFPITHRVDATVPVRDYWEAELASARNKARRVIEEACDNGYLRGDYMDYEIVSTRRKSG